jgi:hypothetical protein
MSPFPTYHRRMPSGGMNDAEIPQSEPRTSLHLIPFLVQHPLIPLFVAAAGTCAWPRAPVLVREPCPDTHGVEAVRAVQRRLLIVMDVVVADGAVFD